MKKFITFLVVGSLTATMVMGAGCVQGEKTRDDITYIDVRLPYGGLGRTWADDAAAKYEDMVKDVSFEDGKMGVDIRIDQDSSGSTTLYDTDPYDIVVTNAVGVQQWITESKLYDITDIYDKTSAYDGVAIKDKLITAASYIDKGSDGKYYGLPYYQGYGGLSYNREVFNNHGLYFTDDTQNGKLVRTSYGDAYFVTNDKPVTEGDFPCELSAGPDHQKGTDDDGLPSTLQELLILCDQMKTCQVQPIIFTNEYKSYANNMVNGLWVSLAGYDAMQTFYSYNGTVNIVDGEFTADPVGEPTNIKWTNETLLPGLTYASSVKKPQTKWVDVNMSNGYHVDDMAAKYYAMAFLEICQKEGMLADATNDTLSHWDTQLAFMSGGYNNNPEIGMLSEETFWWNESDINNRLNQYEQLSGKKAKDLDVRFMPLPTALDAADVADKEAKYADKGGYDWSNTLMASAIFSSIVVPKQAAYQGEGHLNAVLDFLDFLTSKDILKNTNEILGMGLPYKGYYAENDIPCQNKSKFSASLAKLESESKIIYVGADTDIYRHKFGDARRLSCYTNMYTVGASEWLITAYRNGKSTAELFQAKRMSPNEWDNFKGI